MINKKRNRTIHLLGVLLLATTGLSAQQQSEPLGWSACGAYVAPGEWRSFMCYNLGAANPEADPFTPSWEINGGYWQWGRKEMAAAGPSGPGEKEAWSGKVAGWNQKYASENAWGEKNKVSLDPCPIGFRVPSKVEWEGVFAYNTSTAVGSWTDASTYFGSGRLIGRKLFLPAAGGRDDGGGALYGRGASGYYWSSTIGGAFNAWNLNFERSTGDMYNSSRVYGRSVRCIEE